MDWLSLLAVGLIAGTIDATVGQAFGLIAMGFLLLFGLEPAIASATIQASKAFTSFASGTMHARAGNVEWDLVARLVLPGILGGVLGALMLVLLPLDIVKLIVGLYLAILGSILISGMRIGFPRRMRVALIGALAGFVNAMGGGWGSVTSGSLMLDGREPKKCIGSTLISRGFICLAQLIIFGSLARIPDVRVVIPILAGGLIGAPIGVAICERMNAGSLKRLAGAVIMGTALGSLLGLA